MRDPEARSYVEIVVLPCAIAIVFPSMEYVDEKEFWSIMSGAGGVAPIGPPVWRSQLVSSRFLLNHVKRRPSGEKLSHLAEAEGAVKVLIFPRVIESRISTSVEP